MAYEITDKQAREICSGVKDKFLSFQDACKLAAVPYRTWNSATSGDTPPKPLWRKWRDKAAAKAITYWIEKGNVFAEDRNATGVKWCSLMLKALNPDRFKDKKDEKGAQVSVQITQGYAEPLATIKITEGENKQLMEAEIVGDDSS